MQTQNNSIVSNGQIYFLCPLPNPAPLPGTSYYLCRCPQFTVTCLMEAWKAFGGPGKYLRTAFMSLDLMHGSIFKDLTAISLDNLFSLFKKLVHCFSSKCSNSDAFNLRNLFLSTSSPMVLVPRCSTLSIHRYSYRLGGDL